MPLGHIPLPEIAALLLLRHLLRRPRASCPTMMRLRAAPYGQRDRLPFPKSRVRGAAHRDDTRCFLESWPSP